MFMRKSFALFLELSHKLPQIAIRHSLLRLNALLSE